MCGLYVVVYIAGTPMCITDTLFFACGGILGHSDILIGPPVFLLAGNKKKLLHSKLLLGLRVLALTVARNRFFSSKIRHFSCNGVGSWSMASTKVLKCSHGQALSFEHCQ